MCVDSWTGDWHPGIGAGLVQTLSQGAGAPGLTWGSAPSPSAMLGLKDGSGSGGGKAHAQRVRPSSVHLFTPAPLSSRRLTMSM